MPDQRKLPAGVERYRHVGGASGGHVPDPKGHWLDIHDLPAIEAAAVAEAFDEAESYFAHCAACGYSDDERASSCSNCGGQMQRLPVVGPIRAARDRAEKAEHERDAAVEEERELLRAFGDELEELWQTPMSRAEKLVRVKESVERFRVALDSDREGDDPRALEEAERELREESLGETQVERRIERDDSDREGGHGG